MMRPSPPGLSTWTLLSQALVLWIGLFLFVVGMVFTVTGLRDAAKEQGYQSHGVAVDATVTDKSIERAKRGENPRTRYLVAYRFTSSDGREVDSTAEVPVENWEGLEAGQKFPITYLPEAAESSRVQDGDEDARIAVYVFLTIGSIFTLLGGSLAFHEGRSVVRSIRVSRHGLPTEGTIVRVEPTSTSFNRVHQWRLSYEFRDHMGRTQQGESHLLSPEEATSWNVGDKGPVRFDRTRPQDSVWIGHSEP